eukprot:486777-Amphidinium_carterae.1
MAQSALVCHTMKAGLKTKHTCMLRSWIDIDLAQAHAGTFRQNRVKCAHRVCSVCKPMHQRQPDANCERVPRLLAGSLSSKRHEGGARCVFEPGILRCGRLREVDSIVEQHLPKISEGLQRTVSVTGDGSYVPARMLKARQYNSAKSYVVVGWKVRVVSKTTAAPTIGCPQLAGLIWQQHVAEGKPT